MKAILSTLAVVATLAVGTVPALVGIAEAGDPISGCSKHYVCIEH